jgi:plasmid stability protein
MAQGLMLQIDAQTERLLRERAEQEGVSMEEEAGKLLRFALRSEGEAFWSTVDRIRQKLAGRSFPDSADLIREDRDR